MHNHIINKEILITAGKEKELIAHISEDGTVIEKTGYSVEVIKKDETPEENKVKTLRDIFLNGEDERITEKIVQVLKDENLSCEAAKYILKHASIEIGERSVIR